MDNVHIVITEVAQRHFEELLKKETVSGMALRIFLDRIGTPQADVGITFCPPGDQKADDLELPFEGFTLYVDAASSQNLDEAHVDYKTDSLGGELSITAPNLRGKKPQEAASVSERIEYLLNTEINPQLAEHGGMVSLVEITAENIAILRFGGGCHGCGMVDVTLKHGIESRLMSELPELAGVKDVTDHATGENPYYEPDGQRTEDT